MAWAKLAVAVTHGILDGSERERYFSDKGDNIGENLSTIELTPYQRKDGKFPMMTKGGMTGLIG
jgi:hypothetical protein